MHKNKSKKVNKYPLTPQAYKLLKALALTLPACQRKNPNGELMFEPSVVFKGTKDYNRDKGTYVKEIETGKKPLMVNHEVNLIMIWQKDGQRGIDVYVKFFQDLAKDEYTKSLLKQVSEQQLLEANK